MLTLRPIPGQPVPPGARLVPVETADGVPLRAATWRPTTRTVKGTVCLLQGRAEFIEKYYETIGELRARGFCVVAFDWRGQGDSGRQVRDAHKGHVRHFDDYRLDLLAVAEQVMVPSMPEPHFGLAHSMGGAVALAGAAEGWLPFRRLVTVAPMLAIRMVRWPAGASLLSRGLHRLGLGRCYIPFGKPTSLATKPFSGNRLSTDPVRYERNAAAARVVGAGAVGDPTIAWLASAYRAMRALARPATIRRIRTPVLIVAAGADPVCSTPAIERFAARLKTGHLIVLPGARHEILTECDTVRADFWAAFDAFVPGNGIQAVEDSASARHVAAV